MIYTRLFATAFILHGKNILMMKRSKNATLLPDIWAPVGGHLESYELNDPHGACVREIFEETGLAEPELSDLSLRYIVHRIRALEIRTQYVYFGVASRLDVGPTDEGELEWVPASAVLDLETSTTTRFVLSHYIEDSADKNTLYVGTVDSCRGDPEMKWTRLRDWE